MNKIYEGLEAEQRLAWLRMKAQAKYRNEEFLLTFKDFKTLWGTDWDKRGRSGHCLTLSRKNTNKPWCSQNTIKIQRNKFVKEI